MTAEKRQEREEKEEAKRNMKVLHTYHAELRLVLFYSFLIDNYVSLLRYLST